jgi:hypothetical protein
MAAHKLEGRIEDATMQTVVQRGMGDDMPHGARSAYS